MKKISTVEIERIQIFKENQLTIGLDLGDRTSHYCILNEAGEVIFEHELPTTPKGIEEVFSRIPRSRIALETGTHSPWLSRQLTELGHDVIVAHARNVRLIGESSRKDDQLDARATLVSSRTALVNAARGLTKSYGQRLRKCGTEQMNREIAKGLVRSCGMFWTRCSQRSNRSTNESRNTTGGSSKSPRKSILRWPCSSR